MWAMLSIAEHVGEELHIEFNAKELASSLMEDTDFLLLFDPSIDGLEYETDTLDYLGIAALHPENWFDLYNDDRLWWD